MKERRYSHNLLSEKQSWEPNDKPERIREKFFLSRLVSPIYRTCRLPIDTILVLRIEEWVGTSNITRRLHFKWQERKYDRSVNKSIE